MPSLRKLQCLECDSKLELDIPVAEGTRVRCPDCGAVFAAKANSWKRSPGRLRPAADGGRPKLLVGALAVVGVLLLGLGGFALYYFAIRQPAIASRPSNSTLPDEPPTATSPANR